MYVSTITGTITRIVERRHPLKSWELSSGRLQNNEVGAIVFPPW
jgi:hypothetical protein